MKPSLIGSVGCEYEGTRWRQAVFTRSGGVVLLGWGVGVDVISIVNIENKAQMEVGYQRLHAPNGRLVEGAEVPLWQSPVGEIYECERASLPIHKSLLTNYGQYPPTTSHQHL